MKNIVITTIVWAAVYTLCVANPYMTKNSLAIVATFGLGQILWELQSYFRKKDMRFVWAILLILPSTVCVVGLIHKTEWPLAAMGFALIVPALMNELFNVGKPKQTQARSAA